MKKISFLIFTALLIGVTACNKTADKQAEPVQELKSKPITLAEAHALGVYDDASQDVEEPLTIDDSPIVDLNTRSGALAISSVTSEDTVAFDDDSDGYGNHPCGKFRSLPKLYPDSYFYIHGSGFGTSKGSTIVNMTVGSKVYTLNDFQALVSGGATWTDTLLYVGMQNISPSLTREFKQGTIKFTIKKGAESVTKSIKAVSDWRDGNNTVTNYTSALSYGQSHWNVANERAKMNKPSFNFTVSAAENSAAGKDGVYKHINGEYVPEVGDMVFRAKNTNTYNCVSSGECTWNPEYEPVNNSGVIMAVSAAVNNVRTVTIWEMNIKCTSALQKKKYKYMWGLFIPKTGEAPFYGYGR